MSDLPEGVTVEPIEGVDGHRGDNRVKTHRVYKKDTKRRQWVQSRDGTENWRPRSQQVIAEDPTTEELETMQATGLPMTIRITDDIRYSFCDAYTAGFVAIEDGYVVYGGDCANRHYYRQKFYIKKKKKDEEKKFHVDRSGNLVEGEATGYTATDLEEF